MRSRRRERIAATAMVATALWLSSGSLAAQASGTRMGSRADLQAQLESLQQQAETANGRNVREQIRHEIEAIAGRLREGDIYEGDVIALAVAGEPDWSNNFIVTRARTIELLNIPPISVANVLYSEFEPYMTEELGTYLREPRVHAEALKRIAVLGGVGSPGFLTAPGSIIVSDLIMQAGGPSSAAQVNKAEFRRLGSKLDLNGPVAFQSFSLDQLGIRSGDELYIPVQGPPGNFWTDMRVMLLGVTAIAFTLTRIF